MDAELLSQPEASPPPAVVEDVRAQALALPDEARKLRITNDDEYRAAGEFLRSRCKAVLKEVDEAFDPIISAAYKAHKTAVAQKKRISAPIEEAERIVKGLIGNYVAELERQREEEEARRREEARRLAEEEALAEAKRLQDDGFVDAAMEVVSAPILPAPVAAAPPPPRVEGIGVGKLYSAKCVDLQALVRAAAADPRYLPYLQANDVAIRGAARALKTGFSVPGCQLTVDRSVSAKA